MGQTNFIIVYIIKTHFNTYYTGITNNLIRRWKEHVNGESSYLSKFKPKEVVHIEIYNTRQSAAKKERRIKKIGAYKYLIKLKHRQ